MLYAACPEKQSFIREKVGGGGGLGLLFLNFLDSPLICCLPAGVKPLARVNPLAGRNKNSVIQAPVVQRMDNAIHRINHYLTDKCEQNKSRYPLDNDLSG